MTADGSFLRSRGESAQSCAARIGGVPARDREGQKRETLSSTASAHSPRTAIFVPRAVRQAVSGTKAVAAALGIGSLVLSARLGRVHGSRRRCSRIFADDGSGWRRSCLGSQMAPSSPSNPTASRHPVTITFGDCRAEGRMLFSNPTGTSKNRASSRGCAPEQEVPFRGPYLLTHYVRTACRGCCRNPG